METMEALRDALLEMQAEHERHCPGTGEPCYLDRCNRLAYLAHALGIRGEKQWQEVITLAKSYDTACVGESCRHVFP